MSGVEGSEDIGRFHYDAAKKKESEVRMKERRA